MSADLMELGRRAVACKGWRWMPGMRWWAEDDRGRLDDFQPEYMGRPLGALPDLADPATLGCLLALVREVHGPSAVARHIGTNGRGGQEWAICDRGPLVDGWWQAAPSLGYWESEAEALVAALECAP